MTINFRGPLKDLFGKSKQVSLEKDQIDLSDFISILEKEDWGSDVIENGHIKSPIILIVDEKLIQISSNPNVVIKKNTKIDFMIMFGGG